MDRGPGEHQTGTAPVRLLWRHTRGRADPQGARTGGNGGGGRAHETFHTATERSGPPTETTCLPSQVKRTQPTCAACAATERQAAAPPHGARKRLSLRKSSAVTSSRPSGERCTATMSDPSDSCGAGGRAARQIGATRQREGAGEGGEGERVGLHQGVCDGAGGGAAREEAAEGGGRRGGGGERAPSGRCPAQASQPGRSTLPTQRRGAVRGRAHARRAPLPKRKARSGRSTTARTARRPTSRRAARRLRGRRSCAACGSARPRRGCRQRRAGPRPPAASRTASRPARRRPRQEPSPGGQAPRRGATAAARGGRR